MRRDCPPSPAGTCSSERCCPRAGSASQSSSGTPIPELDATNDWDICEAVDLIGWLFDVRPRQRLYAQGVGNGTGETPSHLSISFTYPNGSTALVSLGLSRRALPLRRSLMVIGAVEAHSTTTRHPPVRLFWPAGRPFRSRWR